MGSSCENCMKWWDHQDRNCVSNEKMRFHVVAGEHFRSYLIFTNEYSRRCLPSATQDLTLQLEGCRGKQWHTLLHVQGGDSRSRGVRRISRGWAQFVRDNRLVLGDICLFEMEKATRCLRMKVHLIPKA